MSLNTTVLEIRNRQRVKPSPPDRPCAAWAGVDLLDGCKVDTLTIIFRTSGCWWGKAGGCTMCGYVYDSAQTPPSNADLIKQLGNAMTKASGFDLFMVKIFTSGSFLDTREIPLEVRHNILSSLEEDPRVVKVLVETRPEFVTEEAIKDCRSSLKDKAFEIATGLETSSDLIRKESINKGFTFDDFKRAARIARDDDATVKTYLMLKPLFLSEGQALEDMVRSVRDAAPYSDTFSINLCNIQNGTFVENLWQRGQYRPPWLWSIVEILKRTKQEFPDMVITSDPVGAGSKRGPHNCKECSRDVADAIRQFSITQDISCLEVPDCECKDMWECVLQLDDHTFGAPITD
ncbi:archaeosine biosynthesis radical SAM protein RaSEA [Methanolobus halotolerans]|uniref:TIGR01210 family radical SAM protein n=1 Tax=Methanolobus halotolerans TaxID=2052935 RepID=A0A4E0Q0C7_9EURY|nr:archaeosine biosynthesis radical SAM protein RaSEA [Methanolobus halotolerans]TGC09772.1 TIGR01210 family radical SAM protein [Methanolobus halotolerans]